MTQRRAVRLEVVCCSVAIMVAVPFSSRQEKTLHLFFSLKEATVGSKDMSVIYTLTGPAVLTLRGNLLLQGNTSLLPRPALGVPVPHQEVTGVRIGLDPTPRGHLSSPPLSPPAQFSAVNDLCLFTFFSHTSGYFSVKSYFLCVFSN